MGCLEHISLFLDSQMFFSHIRPSVHAGLCLSNLGIHSSAERGERNAVFQDLHFKDIVPKSLRKTFPALWNWLDRGGEKIYMHPKEGRETSIYHGKFSQALQMLYAKGVRK